MRSAGLISIEAAEVDRASLPPGLPVLRSLVGGRAWYGLTGYHFEPSEMDCGPYIVDNYELHIDLAGGAQVELTVDGQRQKVESIENQYLLIQPGQEVRWVGRTTDSLTLAIAPDLLRDVSQQEFATQAPSFSQMIRDSSDAIGCVTRRFLALARYGSDLPFLQEALSRDVAHVMVRDGGRLPVQSTKARRLLPGERERLEAYVLSHISSATLGGMATACGLSPRQFSRNFGLTLGTTPGRYLSRRRLTLAIELLRSGEETIAHIAERVGFFDQSHLTNALRRTTGWTPKALRALHRT
ncbi:MAG: AraC family transcriptional regulator [Pseudomonadota bacterium]